ncbi:uncharacterized protein FA14DRAFT_85275 [Meira miltonrushii]|uniref:LysM domain-containing protein n=1 Tax=Meira miltonrushii TaxID=1280837 RepID=A0A316V6M4_9BASI|nr:uncharacterized protein FA14DRAFT_85275 [Meira miltonrushii]PWN32141.1 hypothetical protein FA14DRAFT_85275 [Meira miltonrushii]
MTSLLCLTCSKTIEGGDVELKRCIIHSCCSKPVCSTCLAERPRLATFCVRCEGAQHALRKAGPRDDVTRAGQVVFDFDKILNQEDDHVVETPQNGQSSIPPPAYSQAVQSGTFVLEDEDNSDDMTMLSESTNTAIQDKQQNNFLDSKWNNGKPNVVHGQVDTSKAASGINTVQASPLKESLQSALNSKADKASFQKPDYSASRKNAETVTPPNSDTSGLTRQYWLRPNDTLMSLSLRFRVSAVALCKLNELPPSTATSTPHLIHTRKFLLIPEGAIMKALANAPDDANLNSALQGPAPMNRKQKVERARKEAQSKFRSLVARDDARARSKGGSGADVTPCDERAARAYVSLMESELRFVDFGDGIEKDDVSKQDLKIDSVAADDEALIDAARQRRFDAIVNQAFARWSMDSEWEREQRAMGLEPSSEPIAPRPAKQSKTKNKGPASWFNWVSGEGSRRESARPVHLPKSEKMY